MQQIVYDVILITEYVYLVNSYSYSEHCVTITVSSIYFSRFSTSYNLQWHTFGDVLHTCPSSINHSSIYVEYSLR